jgi:hypothetical protein
MLKIQMNRIMKNTMVQFITMVRTELAKRLEKWGWFSSTIKTPEMPNDPEPKPGFKVTYPPNWKKRQTLKGKAKTEYFNKWASKL